MFMKLNERRGVVNFSPETGREVSLIDRIATQVSMKGIQKRIMLEYDGRTGADPNMPHKKRMKLFFRLGSACRFRLIASSDKDEPVIREIRDAIFFGGHGLYVVGVHDAAGTTLDMCVNFCKHCGAPLVRRGRVEWNTCKACVAKCKHAYTHGVVHGGVAGQLGNGVFCEKCGCGHPNKKPRRVV